MPNGSASPHLSGYGSQPFRVNRALLISACQRLPQLQAKGTGTQNHDHRSSNVKVKFLKEFWRSFAWSSHSGYARVPRGFASSMTPYYCTGQRLEQLSAPPPTGNELKTLLGPRLAYITIQTLFIFTPPFSLHDVDNNI